MLLLMLLESPSSRPNLPLLQSAKLNEPVSKPPRPIPTSPSAQVNQQGPSSDPHVESSSKDNDSIPDPNVADDPLGGSFFASPSRSTAAPPEVSEQGKKIESVESELQPHKLLFKDVMGKLDDEEQDVDSLIKLAKAAAFAADILWFCLMPIKEAGSSIHTDAFVHGNDVTSGTTSAFSAEPSNKGKYLMVEEDPPIKERSFRQMEEDRWQQEAARKLYPSWDKYMQIKDLLLIYLVLMLMKKILQKGWLPLLQKEEDSLKHRALQTPVPAATHQSSAGVPTNIHQSPFVDTPSATPPHSPKASSQPDVTPATSVDPTVAPTPPFATPVSRSSGPRTRSQSFDADIKTYSIRRKSLAPRKMPSSEVDLHALDTSFIKVLSDDVFDASDDDTDPLFWHIMLMHGKLSYALGQDLSKLYGMVVKHFVSQPLAECFLAWILYMFADYTIASLSAFTHEEMLKHKLEVEIRWYRDDHDIMTVQLIQFIKNRWLPYVPSA
ncbi:hypothetical protein Tco_0453352 [Tanacetum coccineum]